MTAKGSAPLMIALLLCATLHAGCRQELERKEPPRGQPALEVAEDKSVGRDELIAALASKDFDRTIAVMNRVKRMRYQGDVLPLLSDAWAVNLAALPQVDKSFISHPRIRLEIADILLQASRNGAVSLDPTAYSAYARQQAMSKDHDVARQALLVLGVANEPVDVALLAGVLAEEQEATFKAAATSLARNCAIDEARISRIADGLNTKELQEYLRESWRDAQGLRRYSCRAQ